MPEQPPECRIAEIACTISELHVLPPKLAGKGVFTNPLLTRRGVDDGPHDAGTEYDVIPGQGGQRSQQRARLPAASRVEQQHTTRPTRPGGRGGGDGL